jgi:thioredoxin reductase (NADPH)
MLCVLIGAEPHTEWLGGVVARDAKGFVLTGHDIAAKDVAVPLERTPLPFETSAPGVFAAGDVRLGSSKRVASAVGEGAGAVQSIHTFLASLTSSPPVREETQQPSGFPEVPTTLPDMGARHQA